jgi:F-type H+-transporting ATPase subunit epsilon
MSVIQVEIVSLEAQIFSGEVEYASFPGEMGELGVLPRHAPLLTRVVPGRVRLRLPQQQEYQVYYISGGILEIQPRLVTLLADTVFRAESLDEKKAVEARLRAEAVQDKATNLNFAAAQAELAQSISDLTIRPDMPKKVRRQQRPRLGTKI